MYCTPLTIPVEFKVVDWRLQHFLRAVKPLLLAGSVIHSRLGDLGACTRHELSRVLQVVSRVNTGVAWRLGCLYKARTITSVAGSITCQYRGSLETWVLVQDTNYHECCRHKMRLFKRRCSDPSPQLVSLSPLSQDTLHDVIPDAPQTPSKHKSQTSNGLPNVRRSISTSSEVSPKAVKKAFPSMPMLPAPCHCSQHHATAPSIPQHHATAPSIPQHHATAPSIPQHHATAPSIPQHHATAPSIMPLSATGLATWGKKVGRKWEQLRRSDSSELLTVSPGRRRHWSPNNTSVSHSAGTSRNRRISRVESLRNLFIRTGDRNCVDKETNTDPERVTPPSDAERVKEECQKGLADLYQLNALLEEKNPRRSLEEQQMLEHLERALSCEDLLSSPNSVKSKLSILDEETGRRSGRERAVSIGCDEIRVRNVQSPLSVNELCLFLNNLLLRADESGYESDSTRAGSDSPRGSIKSSTSDFQTAPRPGPKGASSADDLNSSLCSQVEEEEKGDETLTSEDIGVISEEDVETTPVPKLSFSRKRNSKINTGIRRGDVRRPPHVSFSSSSAESRPRSSTFLEREFKTLRLARSDVGELGVHVEKKDSTGRSACYVITRVEPGGPADRDGRFKEGDEIIKVNGRRLRGMTLQEAHTTLNICPRDVVVARPVQNKDHAPAKEKPLSKPSDAAPLGTTPPSGKGILIPVRSRDPTTQEHTTPHCGDSAPETQVPHHVLVDGDVPEGSWKEVLGFQCCGRSGLSQGQYGYLREDRVSVGPGCRGRELEGGPTSERARERLSDYLAKLVSEPASSDEILTVNGSSLQGLTHAEAITAFKNIKEGQVVLHVGRRDPQNKRTNKSKSCDDLDKFN
ncbi:unnamed protein product [Timema podura]|uniref:PDZ domain-containing protein n=1 Tax=Timema podura TaxID=61482 RepID=A0ABN7NUR0_TIMPD|nr:unnamed protein product [Timema podura]